MEATHNDHEFGGVVLLILFIVIICIACGVGYWLWQRPRVSQTTGSTSVSTAVCGDLTLSKGSSDGTAGTIYWHAVLTNHGSQDCQFAGYPAAFMIDSQGTSVGAVSSSLYAPAVVTLHANGGQAHTVIGLPEAANFEPGTTTCTLAASSSLRLYLPGLTSYVEGTFGESGCQGFTVTALQPGA